MPMFEQEIKKYEETRLKYQALIVNYCCPLKLFAKSFSGQQ